MKHEMLKLGHSNVTIYICLLFLFLYDYFVSSLEMQKYISDCLY